MESAPQGTTCERKVTYTSFHFCPLRVIRSLTGGNPVGNTSCPTSAKWRAQPARRMGQSLSPCLQNATAKPPPAANQHQWHPGWPWVVCYPANHFAPVLLSRTPAGKSATPWPHVSSSSSFLKLQLFNYLLILSLLLTCMPTTSFLVGFPDLGPFGIRWRQNKQLTVHAHLHRYLTYVHVLLNVMHLLFVIKWCNIYLL